MIYQIDKHNILEEVAKLAAGGAASVGLYKLLHTKPGSDAFDKVVKNTDTGANIDGHTNDINDAIS